MKANRILKSIGVGIGLVAGIAAGTAHAGEKYKIYLSMSYIGNDWQDEAAKMLKALAASGEYKDKVDLKVQVAGPNAQKQIQQINAMVAAETLTGIENHRVIALPHDRLRAVLKKYNRLNE